MAEDSSLYWEVCFLYTLRLGYEKDCTLYVKKGVKRH